MNDAEFKEKIIGLFFGDREISNDEAWEEIHKEYKYLEDNRKLESDFENFKESGKSLLSSLKKKINSL